MGALTGLLACLTPEGEHGELAVRGPNITETES